MLKYYQYCLLQTEQPPPPPPPPPSAQSSEVLSSARERRRKNRSGSAGRIVLKSRSNVLLPEKQDCEEKDISSARVTTEQCPEEVKEEEEVITLLDTTLHVDGCHKPDQPLPAASREAHLSTAIRLRERSKALRE